MSRVQDDLDRQVARRRSDLAEAWLALRSGAAAESGGRFKGWPVVLVATALGAGFALALRRRP